MRGARWLSYPLLALCACAPDVPMSTNEVVDGPQTADVAALTTDALETADAPDASDAAEKLDSMEELHVADEADGADAPDEAQSSDAAPPIADAAGETDGANAADEVQTSDGAAAVADATDGTAGDALDANCPGWFFDADGDGFGAGALTYACKAPGAGWVASGGDCADWTAARHPGATEICNGVDDDCDGQTDEAGAQGCATYWQDVDGDGLGTASSAVCLCAPSTPTGWATQPGDCNDGDPGSGPSQVTCDDGNACTVDFATCAASGQCTHIALSCGDGNPCTADSCASATGCVHLTVDGTPCDDGNPLSSEDACTAGVCQGTGSCGNGLCDGLETPLNCPSDCGFLWNRTANLCTKPWTWDECPYGFICAWRSAAGGGPICTSDVATWPMPKTYPSTGVPTSGNDIVSPATGLEWQADLDHANHDDWRDCTLAELGFTYEYGDIGIGKGWPFYVLALGFDADGGLWTAYGGGFQPQSVKPTHSQFQLRGGPSGLPGGGERFAPTMAGKAIRDHMTGLVWRFQPGPIAVWTNDTAEQWCQSQSGMPGTWRRARIGEIWQLSQSDPRKAPDGFAFQFADGSTFFFPGVMLSGATGNSWNGSAASALACVQASPCDGNLACDDGNLCTLDACDPATGCQHANRPGMACDDGDLGTVDDACTSAGACKGAASCGNGRCDGIETPLTCPGDCAFLWQRLAGSCSKPGVQDKCAAGFLCTQAGGGNVCVADFPTWSPLADEVTAGAFSGDATLFTDLRTGLSWAPGSSDCAKISIGGFTDWRAPVSAEITTLSDIAGCGSPTPAQIWQGVSVDGMTIYNGKWGCGALGVLGAGGPPAGPCVRGGSSKGGGIGQRRPHVGGIQFQIDHGAGLLWNLTDYAPPLTSTIDAATAYCTSLGPGWRLPSLGELQQIRHEYAGYPFGMKSLAIAYDKYYVWTASTVLADPQHPPWHLMPPEGVTGFEPLTVKAQAVCVKSL